MIFWSELAVAAVLIPLAVWQWIQVRRHRDDTALKVLAVGVTSLTFILTMSVADVQPTAAIHAVLDAISFTNIAWTLLFFCYSIFFLLAKMHDGMQDVRQVRRRVAVEFGVYLLFLIPGLLALYTAAPDFFGHDRDPDSYLTLRNAVYYIGTALYPILAWGVGTGRAIGYLRLLQHKWARLAALGVITAMGTMSLGVNGVSLVRQVLYSVYPGSKWPVMSDLYNIGRISGQILLAVSLTSVPLLTLGVRARERRERERQRRFARALEPFWRQLVTEFPHVLLPTATASSETSPRNLDRMMTEVSDGLSYLAEWSPGAAGADGTVPEQVAQALAVKRHADRSAWAGFGEGAVDGDLPQWEPDFHQRDWAGRARWMVQLSRDLQQRGQIEEAVVTRTD